jgi:predicted nucleotide-binding protein (sugar kinase/HSP70/actin superfamily)
MKRVGIPRALVYYEYFPMWRAFFQVLGMEVVISPPTTRAMVTAGLQRMVAETCLPVKVYAGHVANLRDQGVDYVLVPAIRATEPGLFHCSKFLGLPDLMRAVVENCPPLLELNVDIGKKRRDLQSVIRELGKTITWKPWLLQAAVEAAWEAHLNYQAGLHEGRTMLEVLEELAPQPSSDLTTRPASRNTKGNPSLPPLHKGGSWGVRSATIALVGHPYLLFDSYLTHNLLDRLQRMGVRVLTPEMTPRGGMDEGIRRLTKYKYWVYEGEVTGAAGYYLDQPEVDGVIALIAFGCGPDSTMLDVIQRAARQQHKPLMSLVLDEHSGEAGLVTRLEAFVDMLIRRRNILERRSN